MLAAGCVTVAYIRTYRTVIPLNPGDDLEVARWLTRESFERKAASDALAIITYDESEMSAADIPPKAAKRLPRPATEYRWLVFTATATAAVTVDA